MELPYDRKSKQSILEYAEKLKRKTFRQVLLENKEIDTIERKELYERYNNSRSKGSLGNLLEEYYFLYEPNSNPDADFNEAGVELKVTPYVLNKNNTLSAKERLVLSMINYEEDYKFPFESSHVYSKCALMLIIYYLYEVNKLRLDYIINYIKLFNFPEEDLEIIKNDYNIIIEKIKQGKAHEISESDTNYLGACTKGANSSSKRNQPFSKIEASQRAFCLKQSYMTYILNKYIANDEEKVDSIIKDKEILKNISLEKYVINKLSKYYGRNVDDLKEEFNINVSKTNKSFNFYLAKGMLDVVGDKIEEFEKANINIKTIRLENSGIIREHMSFPAFKYTDIVNQEFEDSDLYELFSTTRYLFMIYKYDEKGDLTFKKAMFWNVPCSDLDGEIKRVWYETKRLIANMEYDNLPKSTESEILHVRPHGRNAEDKIITPSGSMVTKKCFWLNRGYILKQIEEYN